MNAYLMASALAGLGSAFGHSYLSERYILRPMYAARGDNRVIADGASWRVTMAMFHLVSFAWVLIAAATLWLTANPDSEVLPLLAAMGGAFYFASALANLWALRRLHVGNILLTVAAVALVAGALTS
ncbi:hypothetical protein [Terricaulis sp.]|uniref:hypothetical protein n=1 Tax=Terricaulis sp. TaxID=2768686 RepID=UPI003782DEB2